jgi:hypothetical protein
LRIRLLKAFAHTWGPATADEARFFPTSSIRCRGQASHGDQMSRMPRFGAIVRYRSMGPVANAVTAGIGIAAVPGILVEESPFKDVLIPILRECPLRNAKLYLVHVSRRFVRPNTQTAESSRRLPVRRQDRRGVLLSLYTLMMTLPRWRPDLRYASAAAMSCISNASSITGWIPRCSIMPIIRSNISTDPATTP